MAQQDVQIPLPKTTMEQILWKLLTYDILNSVIMLYWLAFLLYILEILYLNLSLNMAIFAEVHYGFM